MNYLSFVLLCGLAACTTASADDKKPTPVEAQIAEGKKLYVAKCASCHGNAGEGKKDAPPVVGKDAFPLDPRPKAKRDAKFHTAADVFAWATKNMPPKKPGKPAEVLTTEQYLAIFAFDLTANGIKLDKPLDGDAAAKIVLHK
jgi:S-disulfanyl-L-cysteine oxidoreductase SoxD